VDKDVMDISRVRQREMLPRLLGQLAARSGQVLNITPVAGVIGLERSTAENYIKLLEAVFLIHRLPAWGTTLGSRVVKHPKVHVIDSGVMAWLSLSTVTSWRRSRSVRSLSRSAGPMPQSRPATSGPSPATRWTSCWSATTAR
jgi:predicted AAA+ superfamily ATPase